MDAKVAEAVFRAIEQARCADPVLRARIPNLQVRSDPEIAIERKLHGPHALVEIWGHLDPHVAALRRAAAGRQDKGANNQYTTARSASRLHLRERRSSESLTALLSFENGRIRFETRPINIRRHIIRHNDPSAAGRAWELRPAGGSRVGGGETRYDEEGGGGKGGRRGGAGALKKH